MSDLLHLLMPRLSPIGRSRLKEMIRPAAREMDQACDAAIDKLGGVWGMDWDQYQGLLRDDQAKYDAAAADAYEALKACAENLVTPQSSCKPKDKSV
jgi:hypothetical protein